jgi:hypothetical protein
MTGPSATRITRSMPQTVLMLAMALASVGGAVALWAGGYAWIGVILGLLALSLLVCALLVSGRASCPACGEEISQVVLLGSGSYEKCPACGDYAQVERGMLRALGEDHVAKEPTFTLVLPDGFAMPEMCCVCGGEPTRTEEVTLQLSTGGQVVRQLVQASVSVPYCDDHSKGAKLDRQDQRRAWSLSDAQKDYRDTMATVLKVRSHAFYLRFRELNTVRDGASPV